MDLNSKLTPHFTLREFIYGTGDIVLDRLGAEAETFKQMVEDDLDDEVVQNLYISALVHENVRAICGGYPIITTSGFRPRAWELYRGRSGASQHVFGKAIDSYHSRMPLSNYYHVIDTTYEVGGRAMNEHFNFVHYDWFFTPEQSKRTWSY